MHIDLHTRYQSMGGRCFRIREFEDSQLELMRAKWFVCGVLLGLVPTIWTMWRLWPTQ